MMLLATLVIGCTIPVIFGVRNVSANEVFVSLPTSFIVSTSLDVTPSKNQSDSAHIVQSEIDISDLKRDRRIENDKLYNFQKNKLKDLVNTAPVDKNSPKINFYNMDCAAGHKCTAIIPGLKTPLPSTKHRSKEEMKNYLRKHGLENGFNYSDDDRVNRHNVVARYFKDPSDNKNKELNARKGRRIGNKFYEYEDYWPGSEYRPKKSNMFPSKSKAKIYKYGIKSSNKNGFNSNSWNNVPFSTSNYGDDYNYSHELPLPSFSKSGNNGKIQYPTKRPYSENKKGVWNRYSSSVISQYDRDTKDWVKISASNSDLGSGYVNTQYKPSYHQGSNTRGPSVSLTVLGLPGIDEPYYTKKPNKPYYGQNYVPIQQDQQHHFSQSPDHPFPPIATSKPSVSYPLNALPLDLSLSSLLFGNTKINISNVYTNSTSSTLLHSNQTQIPSESYLPPDLSSTSTSSTTITPQHINRISNLPITQRTIFQQTELSTTNTDDGGGGGDGDGGGGGGGGVVTNAYAVMAAVGAGLIPASIAAILPVLLGKRKKRNLETILENSPQRNFLYKWKELPSPFLLQGILNRLSHETLRDTRDGPSHSSLAPLALLLEARSPPDPIVHLLNKSKSHNKQIQR